VSYQWETVASNFDEFDDVAVSFNFIEWIIKYLSPLLLL
jgi:hypothetical protein